MKACLGGWSILFVQARKTTNVIARSTLLGSGISAKVIELGICVRTIVLISPNRLANEGAARLDAEATSIETKKSVPIVPSASENLRLKKYDTQDAGMSPEAIESIANSAQVDILLEYPRPAVCHQCQ